MNKKYLKLKALIPMLLSLLFLVCGTGSGNAAEAEEEKKKPLKPLIGINLEVDGDNPVIYEISAPYTKAILLAGGVPVLIPPMALKELQMVLSNLDGVMMIGGRDYPPSLYGKQPHKSIVPMHSERTTFDQIMVKEVLNNSKLPFLGICAGAQVLNIARGGSLTRDIPSKYKSSKLQHASPNGWQAGFHRHRVSLEKDSYIACIYGKKELTVPSSHHQCIDRPGKGLAITSRAPDGVAESIEASDKTKDGRFLIGVQWHPERDYKNNKALFDKFIESSMAYKKAKTNH
ncbi:hypothetical protein GC174_07240 [bacterium]|nr:hypothetical protein [bacterium]